jgi:hypothetical protein
MSLPRDIVVAGRVCVNVCFVAVVCVGSRQWCGEVGFDWTFGEADSG